MKPFTTDNKFDGQGCSDYMSEFLLTLLNGSENEIGETLLRVKHGTVSSPLPMSREIQLIWSVKTLLYMHAPHTKTIS